MENKMEKYIELLEFAGKVMGEKTEIVLHDYSTGEILWMHGDVTGRKKGDINDPEVLNRVMSMYGISEDENESDSVIGYSSLSEARTPLRSSVHIIRENGKPEYVLCINQDVSDYVQLKNLAESMLMSAVQNRELTREERTVDDIIRDIVNEEFSAVVPMNTGDRTVKLKILKRLDDKGVLKVRHIMPKICRELNINQSTYYKYLKEIRTEGKGER